MAEGYVYVLPLRNEDWLKLGMSTDPLRRAREFSRRFFDEFDFDNALLVQFDSVREAGAMEQQLRRRFAQHRAPMPMTIRSEAGGFTEWYRGAHPGLSEAVDLLQAEGHVVHKPARLWFTDAMRSRRAELHGWASALLRENLIDPDVPLPEALPPELAAQLFDAVEAYRSFGISVEGLVPSALEDWVRR